MKRMTIGETIAEARKAKGMTQLDLANKMNVTDKAVSKWERGLSRPDIDSIPRLADVLGIPVDELVRSEPGISQAKRNKIEATVRTVLRCVALAMGVAVAALSTMDALGMNDGMLLCGIGLACIALAALTQAEDDSK